MLFRIHFRQFSIIQLFFFLSLLFFQSYYDYSMAQNTISTPALDNTIIETIEKLNEIAPEINNRDLMDFKNPVSFSPGFQLLLNSDNQEIFIKSTVSEIIKFYAYYEAVNYLYETDKINLIKFIYKDNLAEILQKNIDNLENLITNKIITLYSDTEEELKSAINTLFEAILNIEHSEAKFLMTPLIEKINEKIINKSQEDYFDFDTTNIINYIQTQSSEVINAGTYEKGSRAWWAVIGGIVVGAFVLATIGSFFIGLAGFVAWYYTPNIKTAKFCAKSLIKIYDLIPFIQKPSSHYIFPNSVVANIAFLDGNYEGCIQLCDEWVENAQAEEDNERDERVNRATVDVCEAKILKSRALAKLKRYSEAELLITSTIPYYTLLGQKHIPFMYLGKFFKQQGNTFLAKTNLKIAAEHKPLFGTGVNQFIAFYEYADLLDQMGDGEKALEFYKKADKACKLPWSPPSNKNLAKEYRAMIDEAWTIQVAVSEEPAKDISNEKIVLSPNKTAVIKFTGMYINGSAKQIYANKLDIDIPLNSDFVVDEKYQAGFSTIVKIRCKDHQSNNKNKIKVLFTYLDSIDLTKVKKRVLTFMNDEFTEIVLTKINITDKTWNSLDENSIIKQAQKKIYIEGKAKKNNPVFIEFVDVELNTDILNGLSNKKISVRLTETTIDSSIFRGNIDISKILTSTQKLQATTADYVREYDKSNYKDSRAFIEGMVKNDCLLRGEARKKEDLKNENIEITLDFVKSAGVQIGSLSTDTIKYKFLIENQSDCFYLSGHGDHKTGMLSLGNVKVYPTTIKNEWKQELKTLIISGCSVLDIGDFRGNYSGTAHNANPGLKWLDKGPKFLLGYCFNAPLDTQGSDKIIKNWCLNYKKNGIAESWKAANDNKNGRNACAIDCSKTKKVYWYQKRRPIYFWQWEWFSVTEDGWPKTNDRR